MFMLWWSIQPRAYNSQSVRTAIARRAARRRSGHRVPGVRHAEEKQPPAPAGGRRRSAYRSEVIRFTDGSTGPAGIFTGVHWSPDGKQMVFHRFAGKMSPPVRRVFRPNRSSVSFEPARSPRTRPTVRRIVDVPETGSLRLSFESHGTRVLGSLLW